MTRSEIDRPEAPSPTIGAAEAVIEGGSFEGIAAVLWVPDPEQRHWWREVYVKRIEDKPGRKPVGFRKP